MITARKAESRLFEISHVVVHYSLSRCRAKKHSPRAGTGTLLPKSQVQMAVDVGGSVDKMLLESDSFISALPDHLFDGVPVAKGHLDFVI